MQTTIMKNISVQKFLCDLNSSFSASVVIGKAIRKTYYDKTKPNIGRLRAVMNDIPRPRYAIHFFG